MIITNIHEAKAKLSEFLEAAAKGERVLICKRNRPVAELRAVESARTVPRPLDAAIAGFTVPASFFDPLPDVYLDGFEHGTDVANATRVAEAKGPYAAPSRKPKRP